jgi:hypothetical protein
MFGIDLTHYCEGDLLEEETGYGSDDSGSEKGSSSLKTNESAGHNYMSQDESYSGNVSVVNVDKKISKIN